MQMTFYLGKVDQSKRAMRKKLAELPIAEKLLMLDKLRERTLTIRKAAKQAATNPSLNPLK